MIVRKFKPSDLETVLQLFHEVVHSVGTKYYDLEQVNAWAPKDGYDRGKWMESLTRNITYLVEVDNKVVGFADMTHEGFIDRMYVHKNYQGQGVAFTLFKKLEEEARNLHLSELTTEANVIAKPLAERQGFEVVRELHKKHRGAVFVNYIMRKKIFLT